MLNTLRPFAAALYMATMPPSTSRPDPDVYKPRAEVRAALDQLGVTQQGVQSDGSLVLCTDRAGLPEDVWTNRTAGSVAEYELLMRAHLWAPPLQPLGEPFFGDDGCSPHEYVSAHPRATAYSPYNSGWLPSSLPGVDPDSFVTCTHVWTRFDGGDSPRIP